MEDSSTTSALYKWIYYPTGGSQMPHSFSTMDEKEIQDYMCSGSNSAVARTETFHGMRITAGMAHDGSGVAILERINSSECPFKSARFSARGIDASIDTGSTVKLQRFRFLLLCRTDKPFGGYRIFVYLSDLLPPSPKIVPGPAEDAIVLRTETAASTLASLHLYNPNANDVVFNFAANKEAPELKLCSNRNFLSQRCEYIASMISFEGHLNVQPPVAIPIDSHDYACFNALLQHLYTWQPITFDQTPKDSENLAPAHQRKPDAKAFYLLAHEINMPNLRKEALQHIIGQLKAKTAREELFSDLSREHKEVADAVLEWILKHPHAVAAAEGLADPGHLPSPAKKRRKNIEDPLGIFE